MEELAIAIEAGMARGHERLGLPPVTGSGAGRRFAGLDPPRRDVLLTDSLVRLTYQYALGRSIPAIRRTPGISTGAAAGRPGNLDKARLLHRGGIGAGLGQLKPDAPMYNALGCRR